LDCSATKGDEREAIDVVGGGPGIGRNAPPCDQGSNVVDVYVGYLRKKLGEEVIATVRGMGYRLHT
jgi:hypothetical protein